MNGWGTVWFHAFQYDFNDVHGSAVTRDRDLVGQIEVGDRIALCDPDARHGDALGVAMLVTVTGIRPSRTVPGAWVIETDHAALRRGTK